MHEALHSLSGTDEAVRNQFIALEDEVTVKIAERLSNLGVKLDNPMEKIHFSMDMVQSFSHEYIYDKHEYIDYAAMRDIVINSLSALFVQPK